MSDLKVGELLAENRGRRKSLAYRFWKRVAIGANDECWVWTGAINNGYGRMRINGKQPYAHRISLELVGVTVPDEMDVDHLCLNKRRVNPRHLEVVTIAENVRRYTRAINVCPQGHPYDQPNTYTDRRGRRSCRKCHRDRMREAARKAREVS